MHILTRWCTRAAVTVAAAFALAGPPAAAQCNPSYDPLCGETAGAGPDVSISPDGGTYEVDPETGTPLAVPVTIVFSDPDGVNPDTLQLRLWNGGSAVPVTLTPVLGADGISLRLKGNLSLTQGGDNILVAQLSDRAGNVGSSRAAFRLDFANPNAPVVSPDSHHNGFRDTTTGAFTARYTLASYTSGGIARDVALAYNSDHARPTAAAHIDARPDPRSGQSVIGLSLRMQYWTADGTPGTQVGRESFYQKGVAPFQRLAWRVDSNSQTGSYNYAAVVRSHFSDGGVVDKRHFVRLLLINEKNSRYGVGWSVAGVQRLYGTQAKDGLVVNEGNGVVRFFANGSCAGTECSYVTPPGDFSRLVYRLGSKTYLRTYGDGSSVTFSDTGLMTQSSDRFGNATAFQWQRTADAAPQWVLSRIVDPIGHAVTFNFGTDGYLQTVTGPGSSVAFTYNAARQLTAITGPMTLKLAYTSDHLLTSYTEAYSTGPERTWNVSYDQFRKLAAVTAPAVTAGGASVRPVTTYRSVELRVVPKATEGNSLMNPVPAIPSDEAFAETRDAAGHLTRTTIDRYGHTTRIIDDAGTVDMRWTASGLLSSTSTPTRYLGYVWSSNGQLLQRLVDESVVYEASYAADGLLASESSGGATTWYLYGQRGELVRSWYSARSDSERTETTYAYNARYQLTQVLGPAGQRSEWSYDGNVWANPDFQRIRREDGTNVSATFAYDGRGRIASVTNGLHEVRTTAYDDLDRTIRVTDPLGRHTHYEYTGPHLTRVTDAAGKVFSYTYNALGWLESERMPGDPNSRTYRYDVDGLVVGRTDRRGNVVTQAYDSVHRLTQRTADGVTATFSYPDAHNTVMSNAESTIKVRTVSGVGKLDLVSTTLGARRYDLKTVFDGQGLWQIIGRDLLTYAGEELQSTESYRSTSDFRPVETAMGQTSSVQDISGRTSVAYFDVAGRPVRIGFGNGITQTNTFTTDGRLIRTQFSSPDVDQAFGATWDHDLLGRVTRRTSAPGNRGWTYGYDSLGRLASFSAANQIPIDCVTNCAAGTGPRISDQYLYDAVGNRTDGGAVLTPGTNRYASFKGYALTYDAEGNVTRKTKTGFDQRLTWDSLGQLTSVTTNGATVSYGYDPLGRRVRRTAAGESRYFLYDEDDLLMEVDAAGTPIRLYSHWPGVDRPHSVRVTSGGPPGMYYYMTELPGHVTGLVDAFGSVVDSYRYTPFGEVETETNVTGQTLRFMGRELDPATALYYVRSRWYDPSLARFTSEDPLGIDGGINTYAYAANDPMSMRDPSGTTPTGPCDETPPGPGCEIYVLPTLHLTLNWWETGWFGALAAQRAREDAIRPDPVGMGYRMAEQGRDYWRASLQHETARRVEQSLIDQCQAAVFESNAWLFGGAVAAIGLAHKGGGAWNNYMRPEAGADEAARELAAKRSLNGKAWARIYGATGGFAVGVFIGGAINQIACSQDEYWLSRY